MDFEKLAAERYSLRKYSDKPVEKEKLDLILGAARLAPTAKNIQPQKLLVLSSDEAREKADKCMGCHFNAPLMIIVAYDEEAQFIREDGQAFGEIDASIVATHMLLQAADIGIGSCWVGLFNKADLKSSFSELDGFSPVGVLCFGYPAEEAHQSRMHGNRKELGETVVFC
ncbi:MAG: nitroreductase [Clostridia bacterium]|nr:nitroreductase [Clostridia bacterium]